MENTYIINDEAIIKGKELFSEGKYTIALDYFKEAIRKNPNSKEPYLLEAMSYQFIEERTSKNARSALYTILSIDPDDSIAPKCIEKVSQGELLSRWINLYPICYEATDKDYKYKTHENEFIVNFIDNVTMKFEIIDDEKVKIVGCDYDKNHIGAYLTISGEKATDEKKVIIPSSVIFQTKEYITTEIGRMAFRGEDSNNMPRFLTNIVIPNTVKKIAEDAFQCCSFLKTIIIPASVETIGIGSFSYCTDLEQIVVEKGNPKYDSRNKCNAIIESKSNKIIVGCKTTRIPRTVTKIGVAAFAGQLLLNSVEIPNTITDIEVSAFQGSGLRKVVIPDSVINIGDVAFHACHLQSVQFGDSLCTIGDSAFSDNPELLAIFIPRLVKSIGKTAFNSSSLGNGGWIQSFDVHPDNPYYDSRNSCNAIIETTTNTLVYGCNNTTIPNTIKHIGKNAFSMCKSICDISMPNSIETIGDGAYSGCDNLCKIKLPESVIRIGALVFSACEKLIEITIPQSVTYIGEQIFSGCKNMKSIICLNPRPPYLQSDFIFSRYDKSYYSLVTLYVPPKAIENYKNAQGWKLFKNIIPIEESLDV